MTDSAPLPKKTRQAGGGITKLRSSLKLNLYRQLDHPEPVLPVRAYAMERIRDLEGVSE
jgi:hypothetical protein